MGKKISIFIVDVKLEGGEEKNLVEPRCPVLGPSKQTLI